MKGGESRPDHGDESPRFGPDETVPGWKTPQVERREAACLQRHVHRKVRLRSSVFRRSAPSRGEGREMTAVPTPTKQQGR